MAIAVERGPCGDFWAIGSRTFSDNNQGLIGATMAGRVPTLILVLIMKRSGYNIEQFIKEKVFAHYANKSDVLLLSRLGSDLRASETWPADNDQRTLLEVVSSTPDISVVRDPNHRAYAIIVPKGKDALAHDAIRQRRSLSLLRRMPKSVILAFCIEQPPSHAVFLSKVPPFKYYVGESPPDDSFIQIDDKFRTPGLFVDDVSDLAENDQTVIASNFVAWCEENSLDNTSFAKYERRRRPSLVAPETSTVVEDRTVSKNALEKLINAQAPDVASKLVIPADIALLLSRS